MTFHFNIINHVSWGLEIFSVSMIWPLIMPVRQNKTAGFAAGSFAEIGLLYNAATGRLNDQYVVSSSP